MEIFLPTGEKIKKLRNMIQIGRWSLTSTVRNAEVTFGKKEVQISPMSVHEVSAMLVGLIMVGT